MLYVFRDTVLHGKDADLSYQTNSDILDNVTQAMSKAFPGKPVYATFGNHDYYPTDQFPPHNNELYNDTLFRWSNWIMEPTQNSNFRKGNLCLGLVKTGSIVAKQGEYIELIIQAVPSRQVRNLS